MSKFHAGRIMAKIVRDLQTNGAKGLDVDGSFQAGDPDYDRTQYALAELDLVEVDELPEYADLNLDGVFEHIFDLAHRAFNAGRATTTFLVKGDGYPNLPVGSRVLHVTRRRSWSFSLQFYVVTPNLRRRYLANAREDKRLGRGSTTQATVIGKRPVS